MKGRVGFSACESLQRYCRSSCQEIFARSTSYPQGSSLIIAFHGGGRSLPYSSSVDMTTKAQWDKGWGNNKCEIREIGYGGGPFRSSKKDLWGCLPWAQMIFSLQICWDKLRKIFDRKIHWNMVKRKGSEKIDIAYFEP